MHRSLTSPEQPAVGLVAGWGRYPIVIAEALRSQGYRVSCAGVMHHADPAIEHLCDDFRWIGIGKLGGAIRFFQRHGIRDATMAGKFHKVMLYQPWVWIRHLPDWQGVKYFGHYFLSHKTDRKDDTLLGTLVEAFNDFGIRVNPATDYVPELLVKAGPLTERSPNPSQQSDIRFGWKMAKEMGRLDVGQSVCVKGRAVLAIEAIEGTDACIRRAGELCRRQGFAVVKVAKPKQDMRFDVPTVGVKTLESMVAAGANVLAIEAARTIILDEPDFIAYANRHRLSIIALNEAAILESAA